MKFHSIPFRKSLQRRLATPVVIVMIGFCSAKIMATEPVYRDSTASLESRVENLFTNLTADEKISLLSGTSFLSTPIPRLGLPSLSMADAGEGVVGGIESTRGPATAFPAGVAMAATWDPALVSRIGEAIGVEALNKGTGAHMLLGPAINIQRSPLGGRNGEYFSEDPWLTARLAVSYIEGMQATGCVACVKHYAAYNQENQRYTIDVHVKERALREIYLPAFEAAVKEAHAWTVMSSYNQINGYKASANRYLMVDVLKRGWGFDGLLVSDWGGVQDTVGPLNAGNDLEMPGQEYLTHDRVVAALNNGQATQAAIDDSVRRLLRTIIRAGLLDHPHAADQTLVNSPAHQRLSLESAIEGTVLLKNSGEILPFDDRKIRSVACIGVPAVDWQVTAAGSPRVTPFYSVNALTGIQKRAGSAITINYSAGAPAGGPIPQSALHTEKGEGLKAEYFANRKLEGKPVLARTDPQIQFDWSDQSPGPGLSQSEFSVRWTGTLIAPVSANYILSLEADDGCRLFLDDKLVIDHWVDSGAVSEKAEVDLVSGQPSRLRVEYYQRGGNAVCRLNWQRRGDGPYAEAVEAARKSDVAVVFVSTKGTEGEASDRPSMSLPGKQDDLIHAVAAANKKTIVVLNNGTPVLMPWLGEVAGVVETWFPGQEGGNALAAILFGDVNPSGKLPTTFGARREDYCDFGNYPGVNGHVDYEEGIYVGYRHFDKKEMTPLFPFGHGLSYTTFKYSNLKLSESVLDTNRMVTATVDVRNTGARTGAEVVQLYIHDPAPKVDKAVRELRGFQRVELTPGQKTSVSFKLLPRALAYCDVDGKQWKADAGKYEVQVGASSRDVRLRSVLRLAKDYYEPIPFLEEQVPARPDPADLAAYRPAICSSMAPNSTYGSAAIMATDGNDSTYWQSRNAEQQWLAVDLGNSKTIDQVRIKWSADRFGDSYAAGYKLQTSQDGQAWSDVYQTTSGRGGVEKVAFTPTAARWVRLYCNKRSAANSYKVLSFEVFSAGK